MASNSFGEERRRRITERGSDRMALITGRINALPPTAPSSSPTYTRHAQSMSVSAFDSHFDNEIPRHTRPHSLASSAFVSDFDQDNAGLYLGPLYIYIEWLVIRYIRICVNLYISPSSTDK
jgi:hypothetical protein